MFAGSNWDAEDYDDWNIIQRDMRIDGGLQPVVVDSRSSSMAIRFSAAMARMPPGTPAGTPTQDTEPFWVPCTPAPLVTARQRASR